MSGLVQNSPETICSAAMVRIGEKTVTDLDANNDRSRTAKALYFPAKQFLMSVWPWQWCLFEGRALTRLTTDPTTKWTYKYKLPENRLNDDMRAVYTEAAVGARPIITGFAIQDGHLYTDHTEIYCDYAYNAEESGWPPYFVELMTTMLAAQFANPTTDQDSTAEQFYNLIFDSNGEPTAIMRMALQADARPGEVRVVQDSPFIDVRFAGSGLWHG